MTYGQLVLYLVVALVQLGLSALVPAMEKLKCSIAIAYLTAACMPAIKKLVKFKNR